MSKKNCSQDGTRRGKPGRPTILQTTGDPLLVERASEMRLRGLSWAKIAARLGVGQTTIRRYVRAFQKANGSQTEGRLSCSTSKTDDNVSGMNEDQYFLASIRDDVLEGLPKTFRIFVSLVRKSREL